MFSFRLRADFILISTLLVVIMMGSLTGEKLIASNTLDGFVMIHNVDDLQAMANNPTANYALAGPIDASMTETWNEGAGFKPISGPFTGVFDGQGYVIDGLLINRPNEEYVGLFGRNEGIIRHVGLTNARIEGNRTIGALAGESSGHIIDTYSTGEVTSNDRQVGGLVGRNASGGVIKYSNSTANVVGIDRWVGGLAGYNSGTIEKSYSGGSVLSGVDGWTAGLVGANIGLVSDSYATGRVRSGGTHVGGLVGTNELTGRVERSYSTTHVSLFGGNSQGGGLVGRNKDGGTVTSSFWNIGASGQLESEAGLGLTSSQMQNELFWENVDWNIGFGDDEDAVWYMCPNDSFPQLNNPFSSSLEWAECFQIGVEGEGGAASHHRSITKEVRLIVGDNEIDGFWLAGLASEVGGEPDVLALVWTKTSASGWIPLWDLTLVSSKGVLPATQTTPGTGFSEGYDVYHLMSGGAPKPGEVYVALLSYDPASGAVSVSVHNNSEDKTIVAHGLQANQIDEPVYVVEGNPGVTGPYVVEDIATRNHFSPTDLGWSFTTFDQQNGFQPVDLGAIDRRENTYVRLRMPWDEPPGAIKVWLDDGKDVELINSTTAIQHGLLLPLPLNDQKAGQYEVTFEYLDGDAEIDLGGNLITIGLVEAHVNDVHITLDTDDGPDVKVHIGGELIVSGDGPIDDVVIGVDIGFQQSVLARGTFSKQRSISGESRDLVPLFDGDSVSVRSEPTPIAFNGTVDLSVDPEDKMNRIYRDWNISLIPTSDSFVAQNMKVHEESVRLFVDQPQTLRVMTYNIHRGVGMDDELDLRRIADVIALSGADVIGLQEVDVNTRRTNVVDQAATIADMLGMHFVFGESIEVQGGSYGNAILSRYPILSVDKTELYRSEENEELRTLLHTVIDVNQREIDFYVTHLTHQSLENNEVQREEIATILRQNERPFVLLGDFNFQTDHERYPQGFLYPIAKDAWIESFGKSVDYTETIIETMGQTFRSDRLMRRIDYVFLSDDFEVESTDDVFTIQALASDHIPVVGVIKLKPGVRQGL